MKKKLFSKKIVGVVLVAGALVLAMGIYQVWYLAKAHSTFENYFAFRGCTQLLEKTANYGTCKTASGETVKIVLFEGKWYLEGDLPCGFLCF